MSYRQDAYETATQIRKPQSQVPLGLPWLHGALCSSTSRRQRRVLSSREHIPSSAQPSPAPCFGAGFVAVLPLEAAGVKPVHLCGGFCLNLVCVLGAVSLSPPHGHPHPSPLSFLLFPEPLLRAGVISDPRCMPIQLTVKALRESNH